MREHIEIAELTSRPRDHFALRGKIAQIDRHGDMTAAVEPGDDLLDRGLVKIGRQDSRAGDGKSLGDRFAYASGGSGDDDAPCRPAPPRRSKPNEPPQSLRPEVPETLR